MSTFNITFPQAADSLDQDEEFFEFTHQGKRHRMRVHDYDGLYSIPGLYEALVYATLKCQSPLRISELLDRVLSDWPKDMEDLRFLDLGAGNGIVAERLREKGVPCVVGVDLLPEAEAAAKRDRPGVYDDYVVCDLTDLSPAQMKRLSEHRLNALVTVAALGFGDVPPLAFAQAFNLIAEKGWVAMTIKEDFLSPDDQSGFSILMRRLISEGIVDIQAHWRYCHRLSIAGEQLFYFAVVARKTRHIPDDILDAFRDPEAIGSDESAADGSTQLVMGG